MTWLSGLLPLAAAIWVVVHVVQRFHSGTQGVQEFLGSDFAVHSLLMIGLGWFIPWLTQRQLQPSIIAAARTGLKNGIQQYVKDLSKQLNNVWATVLEQQQKLLSPLEHHI